MKKCEIRYYTRALGYSESGRTIHLEPLGGRKEKKILRGIYQYHRPTSRREAWNRAHWASGATGRDVMGEAGEGCVPANFERLAYSTGERTPRSQYPIDELIGAESANDLNALKTNLEIAEGKRHNISAQLQKPEYPLPDIELNAATPVPRTIDRLEHSRY